MENVKDKASYYDEGVSLYRLGKYEEAIASYDRVIEIDPNYKNAHGSKGKSLHKLGRYEEAIASYDRAIEIDPNYKNAHGLKGDSLHKLGRYEEEIASYDRVIEIDPNYKNAHGSKGKSLHKLGRYEEAIASYDRAIEIDPNYKNAHNGKGNSLDDLGRYEEAIVSFDRAIEIDPSFKLAHNNKAISLKNLGRYEEAIASYDRAIEIDPNYKNAHNGKGLSLANLGRYEEAIASYDRAIEIDPNYKNAHNGKGLSLANLGRYEEAIASYDRAIEIDPSFKLAHYNKCNSLDDLGRYEEAIASYDRAIEIDPNYAAAHHNKGSSLADLGRYEEAIVSFDRAIEIDPSFKFAHNNKAISLKNLGRYEEAIASYDRAIEIDPNYVDAHNNKAMSLKNLGRHEEAIASYDRAIEIDPNYKFAHNGKGNLLGELGRYEEAIESYDRAIEIDPSFKLAHNNKAISLKNLGRHEEAIASYDRAIEIDPNYVDAHNNKAMSLKNLGRHEEAIASYDRAIEIDPNYKFAHNGKGNLLGELGRYEEAIVKYDIEIDSNRQNVHFFKGLSLFHVDRYGEAVVSFDRAIEVDPNEKVFYFCKANALCNLGKDKEAIASYDRALEIDPNYAAAHSNKGILLVGFGREEAMESYDRAIELDPENAIFFCNKGRLLQKMGRDAEALECFNRANDIVNSQGFSSDHSQGNIEFVKGVVSRDREELLKKVIELQKTSIETGEAIGRLDSSDAEGKKAVDDFAVLKQETDAIVSESLSKLSGGDVSGVEGRLLVITQKLSEMQQVQVYIQQKVEGIDVKMDKFAISLELSQQQLSAMVSKMEGQGITDTDQVLGFLSNLKSSITGAMPGHIAEDSYKSAFWNVFQRDLNATYIAAMSVQTDIVVNSKKGQVLGKMGSILSIAGEYIPTIGGGVILLGAILNAVDQRQQKEMVRKFAEMANSTRQMEAITLGVANILTQDAFLDLFSRDDGSMNAKLSDYLMSFVQGIIGGEGAQLASSSALGVMKTMGVRAYEVARNKVPGKSKFNFKKKAAEDESDQEVVVASDDKSRGEKDAHMLSAIIISKIYKGEIFAEGSPDNTAKSMACVMFGHFDLGAQAVESLLVVSHADIFLMSKVVSSPAVEQSAEEGLAQDILERIEKLAPVTEEFKSAFVSAMSARLKTAKSTSDVKFISSLQSSSDFTEMFKAHAAEIFAAKLKVDAGFSPSLKAVRDALQEVETELRDEDGFARNDGQVLVWSARIEYDNPFLNHPELLELARELGINPVRLINVGKSSPEFTKGIFNGIATYGPEFVLSAVFGDNPDEIVVTGDV